MRRRPHRQAMEGAAAAGESAQPPVPRRAIRNEPRGAALQLVLLLRPATPLQTAPGWCPTRPVAAHPASGRAAGWSALHRAGRARAQRCGASRKACDAPLPWARGGLPLACTPRRPRTSVPYPARRRASACAGPACMARPWWRSRTARWWRPFPWSGPRPCWAGARRPCRVRHAPPACRACSAARACARMLAGGGGLIGACMCSGTARGGFQNAVACSRASTPFSRASAHACGPPAAPPLPARGGELPPKPGPLTPHCGRAGRPSRTWCWTTPPSRACTRPCATRAARSPGACWTWAARTAPLSTAGPWARRVARAAPELYAVSSGVWWRPASGGPLRRALGGL